MSLDNWRKKQCIPIKLLEITNTYLIPYNAAFPAALHLVQIVGIKPKTAVIPLGLKNIIQRFITAYGVQAIIHNMSSLHAIFPRVISIFNLTMIRMERLKKYINVILQP